jgi:hypothetical protein
LGNKKARRLGGLRKGRLVVLDHQPRHRAAASECARHQARLWLILGRWVLPFMALSIRATAGLVNLPVRRRLIAHAAVTGHMAAMSLRPLFAILIAVGMFLAPLGIRSGAAMAGAPSDHQEQMAMSDHCDEPPAKTKHEKSGESACCVAMCMAVAPAPTAKLEPHFLTASADVPGPDQFSRSFLAELPTPPPRLA